MTCLSEHWPYIAGYFLIGAGFLMLVADLMDEYFDEVFAEYDKPVPPKDQKLALALGGTIFVVIWPIVAVALLIATLAAMAAGD